MSDICLRSNNFDVNSIVCVLTDRFTDEADELSQSGPNRESKWSSFCNTNEQTFGGTNRTTFDITVGISDLCTYRPSIGASVILAVSISHSSSIICSNRYTLSIADG
jgi:hypothetical protein